MTRDDILDAIRTLARSQGFYGSLLTAIYEADDDARDEFLGTLEDQHITSKDVRALPVDDYLG